MTTKAQRDAILAAIADAPTYNSPDDLVDAIAQAALVGDVGTRYAVIVKNPGMDYTVFGPYAAAQTARNAIQSGALALRDGARGAIYAMSPQPKRAKHTKTTRARG